MFAEEMGKPLLQSHNEGVLQEPQELKLIIVIISIPNIVDKL